MHASVTPVAAILAVCCYYFVAWFLVGQKRNDRSIVPLYEPPRGYSPAMLRYVWTKQFDDRAFWSVVLSVVARGFVKIETSHGVPILTRTQKGLSERDLPREEKALLRRVDGKRKGTTLSLLDEKTIELVEEMSQSLRQAALGQFYQEHRDYLIGGIAFSIVALYLIAQPDSLDRWMGFVFGLAVMVPGAFYLLLLSGRIRDVTKAAREKPDNAVLRRSLVLLGLLLPCLAAIALGGVVISQVFGSMTFVTVVLLTLLTLWFSTAIKTATKKGELLISQIEGFRMFLQSVERFPMNRDEAPNDQAGLYEKYLPYAVALEVDQKWSDMFLALESTVHREESLMAAHSFYIGMWNGKPVEMVFKPQERRWR